MLTPSTREELGLFIIAAVTFVVIIGVHLYTRCGFTFFAQSNSTLSERQVGPRLRHCCQPSQLYLYQAYAMESEYLDARREALKRNDTDSNDASFSLAFSGGGLRAASLALGCMQYFDSIQRLTDIEYLSSVSGGGYTATGFLAHALHQLDKQQDADSSSDRVKAEEVLSKGLTSLRIRLGVTEELYEEATSQVGQGCCLTEDCDLAGDSFTWCQCVQACAKDSREANMPVSTPSTYMKWNRFLGLVPFVMVTSFVYRTLLFVMIVSSFYEASLVLGLVHGHWSALGLFSSQA